MAAKNRSMAALLNRLERKLLAGTALALLESLNKELAK